jgi:hypothetical protein
MEVSMPDPVFPLASSLAHKIVLSPMTCPLPSTSNLSPCIVILFCPFFVIVMLSRSLVLRDALLHGLMTLGESLRWLALVLPISTYKAWLQYLGYENK